MGPQQGPAAPKAPIRISAALLDEALGLRRAPARAFAVAEAAASVAPYFPQFSRERCGCGRRKDPSRQQCGACAGDLERGSAVRLRDGCGLRNACGCGRSKQAQFEQCFSCR